MWKDKTVCVILPAFNEEDNIKNAIEEFYENPFVDDVIVVDNKSTDNTKREILKTEAEYIYEEIPGYDSALCRGLSEATSDLIITCEPDGTFRADDLNKLLVYSDDYDVVFGTRTSKYCVWDGANMNWFLRYVWNTFSMCSVRFASCRSMCADSVQIRPETSNSSKSARCMKAEKLSPRPTGSMIVNLSFPGGRLVRSRNIVFCSTATAAVLPEPSASRTRFAEPEKGSSAGRDIRVLRGTRRSSAGMPPGTSARST